LIRIDCVLDNDLVINRLVINGHSGFAVKGQDIVCAAVSILAHSLYSGSLSIPGIKVELVDKKEYSLFFRSVEQDVRSELRGMSVLFLEGLRSLVDQYPQNICLEVSRS
jgi:uncharacterized protein YsxB (DUF464 family)